MIEEEYFNEEKQSICRIMICQLNSEEFDWTEKEGLYFLENNKKISLKVKDLLSIAKHNSVDLVVFPELSIPEKLIENIQDWSKEHGTIVVCGSHYYKNNGSYIPRSPIIIKGKVFFTEKIKLSPLEKSPVMNEGAHSGSKIIKFMNTFLGNIGILICSDYLDDTQKESLDLETIDILCVPSFQRDSNLYFRRMSIDCENSKNGLYILYSNFLDSKFGDGNSALFGSMDKMYLEKIKKAGYSDLEPEKKIFQFKNFTEYLISDINLDHKRPYANRTILTSPNVQIIHTNQILKNKDFEFVKKISHDDERYKRIDELYVEPREFKEILNLLEKQNIVFIIGDPGIGKTYAAVKILKKYYEEGFEPVWIAGLEKEERELQSKVLREFEPSDNQIVYFEDPFGRTEFEKRDSLFQVFSPILDKLLNCNCKIIITSRKEIFEKFTRESLLEKEILNLKKELNVTNPSYNIDSLKTIFDKLSKLFCNWDGNVEFKELVYSAIKDKKITTPLSIRDLIFVSRNTNDIIIFKEQLERRTNDTIKTFALEILSSSNAIKLILYLIYFCGNKGKNFLTNLYGVVKKELSIQNVIIHSNSFNIEVRSQIGYRIEQFGNNKTAYKFAHPIYEEALSNLVLSDDDSGNIAKTIILELSKMDIKIAYEAINKLVL